MKNGTMGWWEEEKSSGEGRVEGSGAVGRSLRPSSPYSPPGGSIARVVTRCDSPLAHALNPIRAEHLRGKSPSRMVCRELVSRPEGGTPAEELE